jgi:D-galactose 1-dehydrogenase
MADVTLIAIVGVGKIARDQHIPAIDQSASFRLAATVSRHGGIERVPAFASVEEMVKVLPEIGAVAICTPPQLRLGLVERAAGAGLDILMEKPPAATLSEAEGIAAAAARAGRVLYTTWHSRMAAAVEPARDWLAGRTLESVRVTWKEDVRVWHPGQEWIWEPGVGVFDPGINALSVLTRILPQNLAVTAAELFFPANRDAPIAASLSLTAGKDVPVSIEFDFDQRGTQTWEIEVRSGADVLLLSQGASRMALNGVDQPVDDRGEYARLYDRFARLLAARESDVDLSPFKLVGDAYLIGKRRPVQDFHWT